MIENCLFMSNRGSGQVFMQTVIVRELCSKYNKVVVAAHNTELFIPLTINYDNLTVINNGGLQTMWNTIFQNKDDWKVIIELPYERDSFKMRNDNFFDCYREICGLSRKNEWTEYGAPNSDIPIVNATDDIKNAADKFCNEHKDFVIVQLVAGGINPVGQRQPFQPENGLLRRYSVKNAEKLVELLIKDGHEVLNYGLNGEPVVKDCIVFNQEQPQLLYHELAKRNECKGIITIDSSLLHLGAVNDNVVVLWKQTECSAFGYQKCKNIKQRKDIPLVPLMSGFPDSPICDEISPEEIMTIFNS